MAQIPSVATIPPGIVSLADHEAHARAVVDENAWAYIGGGAADEITLRANRSAWDAISLLPRVLRAMKGGHPGVHLLGRELRHPVLLRSARATSSRTKPRSCCMYSWNRIAAA